MPSPRRIFEFDTWRPGYGNAIVRVYRAGTTDLAPIFKDEALTIPAENPQILLGREENNISYGKFETPLYINQAYEVDIDSTDQTGIERPPLLELDGENASFAQVKARGASRALPLADIVARTVHVLDYGDLREIVGATVDNTASIQSAIGAASGGNGGIVIVPEGTFPIHQITIPANVILAGNGRGSTILQCQTAGPAVILTGDHCGMRGLSIDGIVLAPGSIGVEARARQETVLEDCEIARFDIGMIWRGGQRNNWLNLFVTNCRIGARLLGDRNPSGGNDGNIFAYNRWFGGMVRNCTGTGIELSYEDLSVAHNMIRAVGFINNVGTALLIRGARFTSLEYCWMAGNSINIDLRDDDNEALVARRENTIVGFSFRGGQIDGGEVRSTGQMADVLIRDADVVNVKFKVQTPHLNPIQFINTITDSTTIIEGESTKASFIRTVDDAETAGLTVDAQPLKAWSMELQPGQVVYAEAKAVGRQRNGIQTAEYHFAVSARRPGATLGYDSRAAAFTLGSILTGQSSGATARITAETNSGASGSLTLQDIDGEFLDNEVIRSSAAGQAIANGALVRSNVALLGAQAELRAAREDAAPWAAVFQANGPELEVRVTGEAGKTIEWTVRVQIVSS